MAGEGIVDYTINDWVEFPVDEFDAIALLLFNRQNTLGFVNATPAFVSVISRMEEELPPDTLAEELALINQFWVNDSPAGTIYTLSPGGTFTFSGSVAQLRQRAQIPSGLVAFSGTSPLTFSSIGGTTYTLSAGGTLLFSGTVAQARTRTQIPSGTLVFSGASISQRVRTQVPSGLIVFSGSVPQIKTVVRSPSGTLVFSSSSPMNFTPGAGSGGTGYISRENLSIARAMSL